MADLATLVGKRGHRHVETGGGNCLGAYFPELIVKESYSRWIKRRFCVTTDNSLSCNASTFHMQVLGCTFHGALAAITMS